MSEAHPLRELFDQKLLDVLNILLDNQEKKLSLTQISSKSKINVTSTLRILNKLIEQDFVEKTSVGSSKTYQIKKNIKVAALRKMLNKENVALNEFLVLLRKHISLDKVALDFESSSEAKLIISSDTLKKEELEKDIEKIKKGFNYSIELMIFKEEAFHELLRLKPDLKEKMLS